MIEFALVLIGANIIAASINDYKFHKRLKKLEEK